MEIDQYDLSNIYDRITSLEYANEKLLERVEELETKNDQPNVQTDIALLSKMLVTLAECAHLKKPIKFQLKGVNIRGLPVSTLADFPDSKPKPRPRGVFRSAFE